MPKASPIRSTFNAGELSPLMDGRVDVAKYQNGCRVLENFIPSVQGPAVRRAGTRFVAEVKNSAQKTWLQRFEFNVTQAFILEFGHQYIRFYTNHGQVLSGSAAYEVATPYASADLTNSDGTFALDMVQSGDVIYIAHPNYAFRKLSRFGNTNWTLTEVDLKNGPFEEQNDIKTTTVYASATTGTITLKASADIFTANHVGSLFYLEPKDLSTIKPWSAGQELSKGPSGSNVLGLLRRSEGKTYKCATSASASGTFGGNADYPNVIRTGPDKPIHTYGTVADGDGNGKSGTVVQREGVEWEFVDKGAGYVKITGYTDARTVTAVVQSDFPLPSGVVYSPTGPAKTVSALAATSSNKMRLTATGHGFADGDTVNISLTCLFTYTKINDDVACGGSGGTSTGNYSGAIGGTYTVYVVDANTIDLVSSTFPSTTTVNYTYSQAQYDGDGNFTGCTSVAATATGTYVSFTSGTVTKQAAGSAANATFRWAFGSFSAALGYPSKVTFFRERLTLARGQDLFFSVAGDFENFAYRDDSGNVTPDRAIKVQIASDNVNKIEWLVPTQALIIGTSGQEFICQENATNEVFAPSNVKIEQQTSDGSRAVKPVRVGYSTLFVQRSGRKLKDTAYNFQQNGYVTNDMTVMAEHITQGGIVDMDWHQEPYVALWAARADGKLLGFTFNKEQDVIGWHRHQIGGGGIVESLAVIPAPDKSRDEVWMIVRRTIGGATKRYVEYMEREYVTGDAQADAYYVDSGSTYSGAAATTISGLTWLAGQTVQVLADGAAHPDCVVSAGGVVTLQRAATKVQIGFGYDSTLQTNRIEAGAGDGTAQGKTKRINKVVIRFYNTLGAQAGPDESNLDEIQFRKGSDPMDKPPPLFSGDKLIEWPDGYSFDGYVMVKQTQPLPMTVVAIMPQVHTFDR